MPSCRRCAECLNSEHHWLERLVFNAAGECIADFICKHCDAAAFICEACWGEGTSPDGGIMCGGCAGTGRIAITDAQQLADIKAEVDSDGIS